MIDAQKKNFLRKIEAYNEPKISSNQLSIK